MIGFGEYSLPHIQPISAEEKERWIKPIPLSSRIAFLRNRGFREDQIIALQYLWEEWKQQLV